MKNFISTEELFERIAERQKSGFKAETIDVKTLNPLIFAYIGDAYFSLYIREKLLKFGETKINNLHNLVAKIVSAPSQAKAYDFIEEKLKEDEKEIFRRGRNAKSHAKKNTTNALYHASTGFEALIGYLYLTNNFERLDFILHAAFEFILTEN